ncbi:hypothetical protein ACGF3C_02195 [Micromonospora sp. NPDC047762]|uniref:hypothetical protein n=1 Tax=Micromonospora sp. NPDC047762 TaxID=3364255 RepID=UPI0037216A10
MGEPIRDPEIPDLVNAAEAADILKLTRQGVHKRWASGQLPGGTAGQSVVFRRELIEAIAKAELVEG